MFQCISILIINTLCKQECYINIILAGLAGRTIEDVSPDKFINVLLLPIPECYATFSFRIALLFIQGLLDIFYLVHVRVAFPEYQPGMQFARLFILPLKCIFLVSIMFLYEIQYPC